MKKENIERISSVIMQGILGLLYFLVIFGVTLGIKFFINESFNATEIGLLIITSLFAAKGRLLEFENSKLLKSVVYIEKLRVSDKQLFDLALKKAVLANENYNSNTNFEGGK